MYNSNVKPNPGQHHSSFHLPAHSNAGLAFLFPSPPIVFPGINSPTSPWLPRGTGHLLQYPTPATHTIVVDRGTGRKP